MRATKDSGVDWLGEIPADWEVRPCWSSFRRVKQTGFPEEELLSVYRDHGVVLKSSRDDNHNVESEDLTSYQLVRVGDMVMNKMKAWQGSIALSDQRGIVSPAYFVYRPTQEFSRKYFHYLLRSAPYVAHYNRISKGVRVGQWDLDPTYFRTTSLIFPPIEEQRRIADFLDRETAKIDGLIAKQEQLITTLDERRGAVIFRAVTRGIIEKRPLRDSGVQWIGQIPHDWRSIQLKWCASMQTGSTPENEDYEPSGDSPWMRPDNLDESGAPSRATRFFSKSAVASMPSARAGATLVCAIGGSLGKVGYNADKVHFNQQITAVTPNFEDRFAYFVLMSAKQELKALSVGNTLQILNNERLGSLVVPLPAENEQREIIQYLEKEVATVERLKTKAMGMNELLMERRQALISAAVTGKLEVGV